MQLIFGIINLLLILIGLLSVPWTFIGVPLGLFFLFKYLTTKDKVYKKKLPKWIILSFLGIVLSIITPIIWNIVSLLGAAVGGNVLYSGFGGFRPLVP